MGAAPDSSRVRLTDRQGMEIELPTHQERNRCAPAADRDR